MSRQLHAVWAVITSAVVAASGCSPQQPFYFFEDGDLSHYVGMATDIEYPDLEQASLAEVQSVRAPLTLENMTIDETWELGLEEAVRITLENSKVMRRLGGVLTPSGPRPSSQGQVDGQIAAVPGTLLVQPGAVTTVYDPAIIETGPTTGVEAALSEFDAQLQSSFTYEKTDRPQNFNVGAFGFGVPVTQRDLGTWNAGLTKRSATGGRYGIFSTTIFEDSNNPTRQVPSDVQQIYEAQINQPLLQGAGTLYNRIAGPFDPFNGDGNPNFDGVMLARINTDIALADFESGVRNLVNDVEQTYWELYFAYRNLESRKIGRDSALQSWKTINAKLGAGATGGDLGSEAQAREQYFFFRGQVEAALSDLYTTENRLRYLMGLTATDGRLIRPLDQPTTARVVFDWNEIHAEGLARSVELRQQKWRVKQRELELIAAKNLLLPRLDAIARYRYVGLGDDLFGEGDINTTGGVAGTSAFDTLLSGDFQESTVGLQFSMPLGFRRELSTVRNQQLLVARERSRLNDQELELSHQLADAVRVLDANYVVTQTNFNRRVAAQRNVEAVEATYRAGLVNLDLLLDAQRRLADAESSYYRSLVDYNRGITLMHFRKGSLLEYNGVFLAEGPWPGKAYFDAHRLARQRDASFYLDYGYTRPGVVSQGPIEQNAAGLGIEGHLSQPMEGAVEEITAPTPATTNEADDNELPPPPAARGTRPGVRGSSPSGRGTTTTATTVDGPRLSAAAAPNKAKAEIESLSRNRGATAGLSSSDRDRLESTAGQAISGTRQKASPGVEIEAKQPPVKDSALAALDASGKKPAARRDEGVRPAAHQQQWKSARNESDANQPAAEGDRAATGWKRAQR